ncbi:MAG: PAS domain S-box protein [Nitrospirae bacterium]|nr:PAS domain S-box protein [Nitrospirota bacterium]
MPLGVPPAVLVGRNVFDLIHPEDLPDARSSFVRALQEPGVTVSEPFRAHHADGSWVYVEVVSHNFMDDPRIQGILGNLRDVTDRKRLEDERLKTSKLESLGVLAGGIAHDFNNILTVILGNISIARTLAPDDGPIAKRLAEAEKASLRGPLARGGRRRPDQPGRPQPRSQRGPGDARRRNDPDSL